MENPHVTSLIFLWIVGRLFVSWWVLCSCGEYYR